MISNLKLNLHILEKCNHHCGFCFGKYHLNQFMNYDDSLKIIDKIAESKKFSEINIAGGEPLLFPKIDKVIEHIKNVNLKCSIITNGQLLDENFLKKKMKNLTTIGLSIHSFNNKTNLLMGCCTNEGKSLTSDKLISLCNFIKTNSKCKIKINTVVNQFNKNENMNNILKKISIDRFKILKCQEFENNKKFLINDEDYNNFCKNHSNIPNVVFEKNMQNTYIMINPEGNFIYNHPFKPEYITLGSALNDNFLNLFNQLPLNYKEYNLRYK